MQTEPISKITNEQKERGVSFYWVARVNFDSSLRKIQFSVNNGGQQQYIWVKFMFSKKATKMDKIFTVDLTLCSKRQIDGEDFINFCGLLGKHEF